MIDEEEQLVELKKLQEQLIAKMDKYPKIMFTAFALVLFQAVEDDYKAFIKDLDLTEIDRAHIFEGMLENEVKSLRETENMTEFGKNVLATFRVLQKEKKNKKNALHRFKEITR